LQATDPICIHRQWLWYYRAGMGGLCWAPPSNLEEVEVEAQLGDDDDCTRRTSCIIPLKSIEG